MGVRMIEIALGILAGKPDENKALREWAVKILALYSPKKAPLTEQAKNALRDSPLPVSTITFDAATGARRLHELGTLFETPMLMRESARERDG
jgi:hypothetical protein